MPRAGLAAKNPALVQMDDFGFERLGRQFDVAVAQSVFTHLALNDIVRSPVWPRPAAAAPPHNSRSRVAAAAAAASAAASPAYLKVRSES